MKTVKHKEGVTIYSNGYPRSDYGWTVVKDGRITEIGHELGREGGVYWQRRFSKRPIDSLKKEVIELVGDWGRKFYTEVLVHAYRDSKWLPSPAVAGGRFKNRLIKQKEAEIRLKESALRRAKEELRRIRKGR